MKKFELAVVGGGPAGLSAAIEAAKHGVKTLVIDENDRPGGQLFKQIHKFFGSSEHQAGIRGVEIGRRLLAETAQLGIETWLNSEVVGISPEKTVWVVKDGTESLEVQAERIILSTGALENALNFPGWTLPGVMSAGAAQTMINIHRVKPGRRALMIGSGNVGVIVSYQLLQAGVEVAAIIEAAPRLGGYGVHTAKVRRAGAPFYVSHTISKILGEHKVEGAEIVALDKRFLPISGSEKTLEVDTICVATGLTPLAELAWFLGCRFHFIPQLGGFVPDHDSHMESSVPGVYLAGDISGVEEASTAMEEGRLAGIRAAASLGRLSPEEANTLEETVWARLNALRSGPFGAVRRQAKESILQKEGAIAYDSVR
ncbi:MAG: NAD(P)/FAD-dependent oxidoreductase [Clostridia bacterium]|jgi:NADPH-dependent 2,4-dienoyl-CoA reductase/sulfur reductase-like enzyme|nr:NAD(P)/FAD-dependent oxidoreductase [Clostridia bacterium]